MNIEHRQFANVSADREEDTLGVKKIPYKFHYEKISCPYILYFISSTSSKTVPTIIKNLKS